MSISYITLAERLANDPILNPHKINEEQLKQQIPDGRTAVFRQRDD